MNQIANKQGFGLIETVVAMGIGIVVSMVIMSMITMQNKSIRGVKERLEWTEAETFIQQLLKSPGYCDCLFSGHTLDTTTSTWNSLPTAVPFGFTPACAASGGNYLSAPGSIAASNIGVLTITMGSIAETVVGSGRYTGLLAVHANQDQLNMPLKDMQIPVAFVVNTADPANARTFTACGAGAGGSLLANALPVGDSFDIPAGTCRSAIRVDMSMDAFRNDTPPGGYRGRQFIVSVNGAPSAQSTLEFGSAKGGATGHGWTYKAGGLSKTFYISNVGVNNSLTSSLAGDPIIAITNAVYSVSCLN